MPRQRTPNDFKPEVPRSSLIAQRRETSATLTRDQKQVLRDNFDLGCDGEVFSFCDTPEVRRVLRMGVTG